MEGGAKRIVVVLALAAVAVIGVFWYWEHAKQRALGSGNVYVKNQGADNSQIASTVPTAPTAPSTSSEPAPAESAPAAASTPPTPKPSAAVESTARTTPPTPPARVTQPPMTQPHGALEVPASDTIPRNPPNGLIFAGAGKYQLYRQGDITWRLDTNTGRSCIIFATDTQWAKIRVYDSGCGAS